MDKLFGLGLKNIFGLFFLFVLFIIMAKVLTVKYADKLPDAVTKAVQVI